MATPGFLSHPAYFDLVRRVDEILGAFLQAEVEGAAAIAAEARPLAEAVRDSVLQGGKRIRPVLCYLGWSAVRDGDAEPVLRAAASLELVHAFALMHDDILDASDLRRGRLTVHKQFEEVHARNGWRGSSADYGVGAGLLGGDLLLSYADRLFSTSGVAPGALLRARSMFDELRSEMILGQYLEFHVQAIGATDPNLALRVLHAKSGHYTVQKPLLLGAMLGSAGDDVATAFAEYGEAAGEAFQLRDDMLGVFGDPAVTGKPTGDDLREGKRTVLVAEAAARGDDAELRLLLDSLGDRTMSSATLDSLRQLFVDTGAVEQVERRIADATQRAAAALDGLPIDEDVRRALDAIAVSLAERSF